MKAAEAICIEDESITFENALRYWDGPKLPPHLCLSNEFDETTTLILQWNDSRTLFTPCDILKSILSACFTIIPFDSSTPPSKAALPPNLLHLMHQNQVDDSQAVEFLLAKAETANKTAATAKSSIEFTNRKLGYINEEKWRQRLADEEGLLWARPFEFDSLAELVNWIGTKLKTTRDKKQQALETLVEYCVGGFRGFHEVENREWHDVSNSTKDFS